MIQANTTQQQQQQQQQSIQQQQPQSPTQMMAGLGMGPAAAPMDPYFYMSQQTMYPRQPVKCFYICVYYLYIYIYTDDLSHCP